MVDRKSRKPLPEQSYVSLSEALTWIAFGTALGQAELQMQVEGVSQLNSDAPEDRVKRQLAEPDEGSWRVPGEGFFEDREKGLESLSAAWRELRAAVDNELITVRGQRSKTYSLCDAKLAKVKPLTGELLATFSQFDVSTGGIRRRIVGSPAVIWNNHEQSFEREFESFGQDSRAAQGYLCVEVERHRLKRYTSSRPAKWKPVTTASSQEKKPELSAADLNRWYSRLSQDERKQPVDRVLVPKCRDEHPKQTISRERIRDLFPHRKRGPTQFRGDLAAKLPRK